MEYFFILLLIGVNAILGTGIFLRNSRVTTYRLYAAFVATLTLWILANFLENEPEIVGEGSLAFFLRMDFSLAVFICYFWVRFCSTFVGSSLDNRWVRIGLFCITIPAALFPLIGDLLIADITFYDGVIHFDSGAWWPYYGLVVLGQALGGFAILLRHYLKARRSGDLLKKRQIGLVLLGAFISIGIAIAINLPQAFYPLSREVSRIGIYGMVFLVAFTAYAMARARLFEVKLLIARSLGFLFFVSAVSAAYVAIVFFGSTYIFHTSFDARNLITAIIAGVIVTTTAEYFRRRIASVTDAIFFKGRYDADLLLKWVGRILLQTTRIEDMGEQIVTTLSLQMRLEKVGLVSIKDNIIRGWSQRGFTKTLPFEMEAFMLTEGENSRPIITDDLPEGKGKEFLRRSDVAAVHPLTAGKRRVGFLLLGQKRSGEPISEEDASFLEILASEIAIGMQNAQSYEEIRRFNQELELRVEERTKELKESQGKELIKAQEVARLKDEFVFLAVHELRTPITAIRGFLELTQIAEEHFPKDIKENLDAIAQASTHINQLVNDILEIARSGSGSMIIMPKPEEFQPILDDVLREVGSLVEQKHLSVSVHVQPLPKVLCDRGKVKEVLVNLVGNAIKYNRSGGLITINAYPIPKGGQMLFEITDTGYGIPKDQQGKIFEKFFRATSDETREIIGTGLGLFITKMLIDRMGGMIQFHSLEKQGTTFSFTLPVVLENAV